MNIKETDKMKVLVFGGTGAMGTHLVEMLSKSGISTVVTTRKNRPPRNNIKYLQGDAHEISFLHTVLEEHWDAIIDFMVYRTEEFKERIELLLGATSQYIFLSSARVYADSESPITEESPRLLDVSKDQEFLSTDEYSLTKARQENMLRDSEYKNWTIIRPYITYSEIRLQLGVLEKEHWLYRALHGRTIVFSNDISSKFTTLTYGLDVAKGIFKIVGDAKAFGQVFHITTKDSYRWENIFSIYLDILEKRLEHRPKIMMLDTDLNLENRYLKYQVIYDRCFNRQFDNTKIEQFIDTDSFMKMESGLKKCMEIFLDNPQFDCINWRAEALKDRKTGERTPLSEISSIKQKIVYILYRYIIS